MPKTQEKEPLLSYESVFALDSLTMKNDFAWYLKITLSLMLPQSFRVYTVKMTFNEKPFEARIKDLENEIKKIEEEASLFPDGKNKQVSNIKKQIKSVETELADMRDTCPEFDFTGIIEALQYKKGDTQITLRIPSEIVGEINTHRLLLENYKVVLIRE